jgi:hypothetical protein
VGRIRAALRLTASKKFYLDIPRSIPDRAPQEKSARKQRGRMKAEAANLAGAAAGRLILLSS